MTTNSQSPKALLARSAVHLILPWVAIASFCHGTRACAQWSDSFEGGEPRWRLVESDCAAQITGQEISLLMPHGGQTCEFLEMACGNGTMALLAYPIEPCTVIEEFTPRLWTRCASSQIRLGVRVVFPFAAHPVTRSRLTTILWGDTYVDTGQWQNLAVNRLPELLERETAILRQRFGSEKRFEGAYIDSVVLNAYTGPGRYRLQIDDLELRGLVSMSAIGNPPPPNWRAQWKWRFENPVSAESRYWSQPNAVPVWLQYRDEDLTWMQSLGITGIVTDRLPSSERLVQARQNRIGVICPPPEYALEFPEDSLSTVKGWLIGAALDTRQTKLARKQAEHAGSLPSEMRRPLVAEVLEGYFSYSRFADEVIVPKPIAASPGAFRDKIEWLSRRLDTTRQRGNGWVSVNVGVPPAVAGQLQAAQKLVSPALDESIVTVDPSGFRHQATNAILSGSKGILLRTFRPLDVRNSADSAQVAALRLTQNDLGLWGPWIMGGETIQPPVLNDPNWLCGAWAISQSQLIIAQNCSDEAQFCVPPTMDRPIEIGCTTSPAGQTVFRLTHGTTERLEVETTAAGISWRIEHPSPVETFVVSSNPVVINFLRQKLASTAEQDAADQVEIASFELGHAARVVEARHTRTQDPVSGLNQTQLLSMAQRQIDNALQALRTGQASAASRYAADANNVIHRILYSSFVAARSDLKSSQATPLIATPGGLHLHWRIANACSRSVWETRFLPGSSFTDLNTMLDSGWSQQRRLEDKADLRVELVPATSGNPSGLRLAAYAKKPDTNISGGFAGASLRVRSSATDVVAGQFVRVTAQARVLSTTNQPGTGLLIYDNQIGPSLGQLISAAAGTVMPVELYRFAISEGEFRLLAECRGECDIVLENIRMDVVSPATTRQNFLTTPLPPRLPGEITTNP